MTLSENAALRRARSAGLRTAAALLLWAATATGAAATAGKPPVDRSAWESGWHVVRPGDTLEGLADRYLGSSELWRELHALNPSIQDPDLLFPGQRLQIFLERPTAKLSAQVMTVARDVRELPHPVPWRPASAGDVLLEHDALRTAKSASALLRFDDGATVTLSEESLVFIRQPAPVTSTAPRKEIEIELGQADIESALSRADASNPRGDQGPGTIEVVVAGARALASAAGGSPSSTRSRRTAGAMAQFMVFTGKSTVSAAGASIEVPAGNGTSVPAKARPGPLEPLLPAPSGMRPEDDEELAKSDPVLSWNAVSGAEHYTVEVCRDAACGELVDRVQNVTLSPLVLPTSTGSLTGTLYWRVTAVAPSGLDGFPSATLRLSAVDRLTPLAPALALRTTAGEVVPANGCVATAPELVVRAVDRHGASLPWQLLLDGREIRPEAFRSLALVGRHEVAARVTDARGRRGDSPTRVFTVDTAAPWVDLVPVGAGPVPNPEEEAQHRRHRRGQEPAATPTCDFGLEVLDASGLWSPVPCSTAGASPAIAPIAPIGPVAPVVAVVALDPAHSTVTLRTTSAGLTLGGMFAAAPETLRLSTWDVGCGSAQLALRIAPSPYSSGRMMLEAEVTDGAGNRRTQGWHVGKR